MVVNATFPCEPAASDPCLDELADAVCARGTLLAAFNRMKSHNDMVADDHRNFGSAHETLKRERKAPMSQLDKICRKLGGQSGTAGSWTPSANISARDRGLMGQINDSADSFLNETAEILWILIVCNKFLNYRESFWFYSVH
jgi:hypothetical protein